MGLNALQGCHTSSCGARIDAHTQLYLALTAAKLSRADRMTGRERNDQIQALHASQLCFEFQRRGWLKTDASRSCNTTTRAGHRALVEISMSVLILQALTVAFHDGRSCKGCSNGSATGEGLWSTIQCECRGDRRRRHLASQNC